MPLYDWSQTANSNASADPTINWAEGQAPSSLNDSARAMMAATAMYRDDIAGAIVTSGSSTAYTVASYSVYDTLAHLNGQMIAFTPHATNGAGPVTLNVDGLGIKALRTSPGVELLAGTLILGTPYVCTYNNSDGAFYLQGFVGASPYLVPLASGMDFWGSTAPNSSFAFPIGQAISRTTYATLFSIMGTTYGTGDGSTTFNLPDKTGRVSAMLEATATRLTTAGSGVDGGTMGAHGDVQSKTLVTGNLPPYTPAGTNAASSGTSPGQIGGTVALPGSFVFYLQTAGTPAGGITVPAQTFTGTAQGGTSTPFGIVQPTIVTNYIIRII